MILTQKEFTIKEFLHKKNIYTTIGNEFFVQWLNIFLIKKLRKIRRLSPNVSATSSTVFDLKII